MSDYYHFREDGWSYDTDLFGAQSFGLDEQGEGGLRFFFYWLTLGLR